MGQLVPLHSDNPFPFAIGEMEVDSGTAARSGMKGRGLKVLHHFPAGVGTFHVIQSRTRVMGWHFFTALLLCVKPRFN
jgi:hypothetical protein